MEGLIAELLANIEVISCIISLIIQEKQEIKQSIKEIVESIQQNETDLQNLRSQFKSSSLTYSQKIEINQKIDKLLRGNQEYNEIREKLSGAMKVFSAIYFDIV
jgi:hypothetical protein